MTNKLNHITKILGCIESCNSLEQLDSCENMLETFYYKYPLDEYSYRLIANRLDRKEESLLTVKECFNWSV